MTDAPRVREPSRKSSEELRPFGHWFLTELSRRGWTQADFARASGSHTRRISDWLYRAVPDLGSLQKISDTLGIPIEAVILRALDKEPATNNLADEIGQLAQGIPHQLLVPFAVALRSLQNPEIQKAALRDLEAT